MSTEKGPLVEQPTGRTTRKVKAGAYGAAVSGIPAAVLVSMLARWFDLDVAPEEAIIIGTLCGSALSALGSWAVGYQTRERDSPEAIGT